MLLEVVVEEGAPGTEDEVGTTDPHHETRMGTRMGVRMGVRMGMRPPPLQLNVAGWPKPDAVPAADPRAVALNPSDLRAAPV